MVFAYNPFREPVMKPVLEHLNSAILGSSSRVVMVYYNDRPTLMQHCPSLQRKATIAIPFDITRRVQRTAAVYANFDLERGPDWQD